MLKNSQNKKARVWAGIIYPESMHACIEQWPGIIQHPYCYILHDKDTDENGEVKKAHYHIMIQWPNNTTAKAVISVLQQLGATEHAEAVNNEAYYYQYLTHANEPTKHKYSPEELINCNGYEPKAPELTPAQTDKIVEAIADAIIERGISNYADAYQYARMEHGKNGTKILRTYAMFFNSLTRGIYLKQEQAFKDMEREAEARRASYFKDQQNKTTQA